MSEIGKRIAIYIDGSNLYHKLKKIKVTNTSAFNYRGFCDMLARGREVMSYRYYVGVIRARNNTSKELLMRIGQQRLFNNLAQRGFIIKRGYLMQSGDKYHEKGVDVKIATDMLIGAYESLYDTAIIVSSDTDLIPAIQHIRYLGKEIEYVGFSHQPSFGLQKYASLTRLLLKDDLDKFIKHV